MTTVALSLLVVVPMALGVAVWWWLLMWGARKDGEYQRQHDLAGAPGTVPGDTADREDRRDAGPRYPRAMDDCLRLTIAYDEPDADGWIVAHVIEVPGAVSQGRSRAEAHENILDALRVMLTPDDDARSDESVELHVRLSA